MPRSFAKRGSKPASSSCPVSRPRRSFIASGSERKSSFTVPGSSPSREQNSPKAPQMFVVRTPPKSTTSALWIGFPAMSAEEAIDGIDREPVEAWFEANVEGAKPPLTFDLIAGGRSNLTYGVTDAEGRRWALRRPPIGKTLGSAHDMGRETKVVSALAETKVPVAPIAGYCTDESVNGAPFYVMDFVEGPILRMRPDAD